MIHPGDAQTRSIAEPSVLAELRCNSHRRSEFARGARRFHGDPIEVEIDSRDIGVRGEERWEWIKKGVPLIIEIGPRDIESRKVAVTRRDQPTEKEFVPKEVFIKSFDERLEEIQDALLVRATEMRERHTMRIRGKDDFTEFFTPQNKQKPEIHGGFALAHWAGSSEDEEEIQKAHKVTIRCIPDGDEYAEDGECFYTGKPSKRLAVFAKSY